MAARKDTATRFVEETTKYTKSVREMRSSQLDPDVVASLLQLVKGIDHLLTKSGDKELKEKDAAPVEKKPVKKSKQPKAIEFDIGVHLPKNYNTPVIPLNGKNCPGLTERRQNYKTTPATQKKKWEFLD